MSTRSPSGPLSPEGYFTTQTTSSPVPHVSDLEAKHYYAGLPSAPVLIARTGPLWVAPTGPEAYLRAKELSPVGIHEISKVWEDDLALKVHAVLDENGVDWSSTDVIRMGYIDDPSRNVTLWIGTRPGSLSFEVGANVVLQCKRILLEYDIHDVEVEIRESEIIRSAGPPLLQPASYEVDSTIDVREPLTTSLGITICARSTPWAEGTGGFFIDKGSDGGGLLLVTVHHVIFPDSNMPYEFSEDQPRHEVLVLSQSSFQQHLAFIKRQSKVQSDIVKQQGMRMKFTANEEDKMAIADHEAAEDTLKKAKAKAKDLARFREQLSEDWCTEINRILGHVIFSPPIVIGAGTEQYTQDIAVIDVDASKIDPGSFSGNVIHLGTKFSREVLADMMNSNRKPSSSSPSPSPSSSGSESESESDSEDQFEFNFPGDRLFRLQGTISGHEMRNPEIYNETRDGCIMVLKRGKTTDLTVGRANNIISYTRFSFGGNYIGVSKEWAITPFNNTSGAFSAKGDSGSVVVDGAGRIGGLLTGGSGLTDPTDVTYVTPIDFIMTTIRSNTSLANAHLPT